MLMLTAIKAASLVVNLVDTYKVLRLVRPRRDGGKRPRISTLRREQVRQTLTLWVVWVAIAHLESLLGPILVVVHSHLPFPMSLLLPYPTFLLSLHIYLLISRNVGSYFVYRYAIKPLVQKYERKIDLSLDLLVAVGALAWMCILLPASPLVNAMTRIRGLAVSFLATAAGLQKAALPSPSQSHHSERRRDVTPNCNVDGDPSILHPSHLQTTAGRGIHAMQAKTPTRARLMDLSTTTPQRLRQVQAQAQDVLASLDALRADVAVRSQDVRQKRMQIGKRARERDSAAVVNVGAEHKEAQSELRPSLAHERATSPMLSANGTRSLMESRSPSTLGKAVRKGRGLGLRSESAGQEGDVDLGHDRKKADFSTVARHSPDDHATCDASLRFGQGQASSAGGTVVNYSGIGETGMSRGRSHGAIVPRARMRTTTVRPENTSGSSPGIYRLAPATLAPATPGPNPDYTPSSVIQGNMKLHSVHDGSPSSPGTHTYAQPALITPMLPGGFRFSRSAPTMDVPTRLADLKRMEERCDILGTGEQRQPGARKDTDRSDGQGQEYRMGGELAVPVQVGVNSEVERHTVPRLITGGPANGSGIASILTGDFAQEDTSLVNLTDLNSSKQMGMPIRSGVAEESTKATDLQTTRRSISSGISTSPRQLEGKRSVSTFATSRVMQPQSTSGDLHASSGSRAVTLASPEALGGFAFDTVVGTGRAAKPVGKDMPERPVTQITIASKGPLRPPRITRVSSQRSQAPSLERIRDDRREANGRECSVIRKDEETSRWATSSRNPQESIAAARINGPRKRSAAFAELSSENEGVEVIGGRSEHARHFNKQSGASTNMDAPSRKSPRKKRMIVLGAAGRNPSILAPGDSRQAATQPAPTYRATNKIVPETGSRATTRSRVASMEQAGLNSALGSDRSAIKDIRPKAVKPMERPLPARRVRLPDQTEVMEQGPVGTQKRRVTGQDGPQRPCHPARR